MKNLLAAVFALALAGNAVADDVANSWVGLGKVHGGKPNNAAGATSGTSPYFDSGRVNTREASLNLAVPSTTPLAVTGTPFVDQAFVIPYTALGINQRDVVAVIVTADNGSTTNFDYLGWFAAPDLGTQTVSSMSNKQKIYGGIRADQRNIVVFNNLGPSNKTGTLYIANGEAVLAAQGVSKLEVVIWSRTNTVR